MWLLGLPGGWLLDDFSLLQNAFPSLLRPRPLTYLTFWLNGITTSDAPWAYRLTNIALHAVAVQYCFRALRQLVGPERALFAAAVFAVHPLQADAVLYVFSRPVVLMGLLLWVALDRWLEGKRNLAILFYALALLAKEEAVAFPLVLAALHLWNSRDRREWQPLAVMAALAVVAVGGTALAATQLAGSGAGTQAGVSPLQYLATQPLVIAQYLKQAVWPQFPGMRWAVEIAPLACLALWLVPVLLFWRYFNFWLVAALLMLLPTSSIFPIADLAASRRMYMAVAFLGAALPANRVLWVVVAAFTIFSADWSANIYREPREVWRLTVERQPGRLEPLLQYVKYLPPAEALAKLEANPQPDSAAYQTELGRIALEMGQPAVALHGFGKALAIEPGVASHLYNRGVALLALGQKEAAEGDFRRALEIDPEHGPAKAALARVSK